MWGELVIESLVRPRRAARRRWAPACRVAQLLQAAVLVTCVGMVLGYPRCS